jgi:hypothetical protein
MTKVRRDRLNVIEYAVQASSRTTQAALSMFRIFGRHPFGMW